MMEEKEIGFSFAPGALDMLIQGKKNESHKEYSVYLTGDLCQMAAQAKFLKYHGVDFKFNNVYPCVKLCDKKKTFKLLWDYKCDGWWNYRDEYAELGICDKEKFKETLEKWCNDRENSEFN